MRSTKYSSVYKLLAVALVFSPAVALYIFNIVQASNDVSGIYELANFFLVLPAILSVVLFIVAIFKFIWISTNKF